MRNNLASRRSACEALPGLENIELAEVRGGESSRPSLATRAATGALNWVLRRMAAAEARGISAEKVHEYDEFRRTASRALGKTGLGYEFDNLPSGKSVLIGFFH
jgi:hypothetical protein